jgi:hypothetical protein
MNTVGRQMTKQKKDKAGVKASVPSPKKTPQVRCNVKHKKNDFTDMTKNLGFQKPYAYETYTSLAAYM